MWMGMGLAVGQPPRARTGGQGPIAPANTTLPTISGTVTQGQTLTATSGTWTGDAPITYAYQWQRSGLAIPGATAGTYVLQGADVGLAVRVVVKASNAGGAVSATSLATGAVAALPLAPVTAMSYAQSEVEYVTSPNNFYNKIPMPTPGPGNLVVFTQDGDGAAPVRTEVNAATVAARQVNPAMAAWSALFHFVQPGRLFVWGDGSVSGTGRRDLHDSTTDNTEGAEGRRRWWSDYISVVNAIEAEFGPVKNLVECWYAAEGAIIPNFGNSFWPSYFGKTLAGATFPLGTVNGVTSRQVDFTLWDGDAVLGAKGRGIFARNTTTWHILTPMPFLSAPLDPLPEALGLSTGRNMEQPAREVLHGLVAEPLAQSVRLTVGPSAHITRFGGGSSDIHPDVDDPDGQILFSWPMALAILRGAGMTINEPVISGIEGPTNGAYIDLVVDLPNGGTLTTLRALRGQAVPTIAPHQQAVTGVEIGRPGSDRRPVFRTTETNYPAQHRGTVVITDTGSGSPKRGKVRVTPAVPFEFGAELSYLRGVASGMLSKPRDQNARLYLDMLIEHVPALYDATALYPMEGIAIRPFQSTLAAPVPAPAFTARGAYFNGSASYSSSNIGKLAGGNGLLSVWFKSSDSAWNASTRRLLTLQAGATVVVDLYTASSGRMSLRLSNNTASNVANFYATPASAPFITGQWYHLIAAWTGTGLTIYINGVMVSSLSYASLDMNGQTLTRIGVGSNAAGTQQWLGDLGHLYVSVNQTLDMSVLANRQKFALAGAPVDLGPNGQTPTGTSPAWYYDGTAPAWANQGTVPNVPLTGTLTPSSTVPGS